MKKTVYLIVLLMLCMQVQAEVVSKEEARQKALEFVLGKASMAKSMKAGKAGSGLQMAESPVKELYAFNVEGGGFVIVSGDDRTEAILGYSEKGRFDAAAMPENMRGFLEDYARGIRTLDRYEAPESAAEPTRKMLSGKESIEPLVKSKWDQEMPYQLYCPTYEGVHSAPGCGATAMAQIMYYHKWPDATTTLIPAFRTIFSEMDVPEIPAGTPINWAAIADTYNSSQTLTEETATESEKAVAQLLYICGNSIFSEYYMDEYGQAGSVVADIAVGLVNYLDYEERTVRYVQREHYSYDEWQNLIYNELAEGRPVMYSGCSDLGGHGFVCDGYDKDDFFHINWGWAGKGNGFFRLRLLNPHDPEGTSAKREEGFFTMQDAVIGIQKNDGVTTPQPDYYRLGALSLICLKSDFHREKTSDNFNLEELMIYHITNYAHEDKNFELGLRILNSKGETVEDIRPVTEQNVIYALENASGDLSPSFGANYPDGDYRMVLISRESAEEDWYVCKNDDRVYAEFSISGLDLTVKEAVIEVSHEITGSMEVGTENEITYHLHNTSQKKFIADLSIFLLSYENYVSFDFVELAPGESYTYKYVFVPEKAGTDCIWLLPLEYLIEVEVEEPTGIVEVSNDNVEDVRGKRAEGLVYSVQGIPVGRADKLDELKPGVYIAGGKKILKIEN